MDFERDMATRKVLADLMYEFASQDRDPTYGYGVEPETVKRLLVLFAYHWDTEGSRYVEQLMHDLDLYDADMDKLDDTLTGKRQAS